METNFDNENDLKLQPRPVKPWQYYPIVSSFLNSMLIQIMVLFIFTTQVVQKIELRIRMHQSSMNTYGSRFESLQQLKLNLNLKQDIKYAAFAPLALRKKLDSDPQQCVLALFIIDA